MVDNIKPIEVTREPVLTTNGDKKWLIVKEEKVFPVDENKTIKEIVKEDREAEAKNVFQLMDPNLWQCNKCGNVMHANPDAPVFCPQDQGGCNRASTFKRVTKPINNVWVLPIWEDIDYEGMLLYQDMYNLIKNLIVFPQEIHYKIFTLWIISTWKADCFDAVGFPVFRGIISSGKTRALNIIRELGYRVVSASSATFPAIATLSHYWNVTLTIDEADNRLNPKYERGSELLDFVKQSYKQGSMYVVSDMDHKDQVIARNNFGFKAFAGEKTFNSALVSRGIDIFMEKSDPPCQKMKYLVLDFEKLRTRLLNYKYKTGCPPDLGEDFVLKGRLREVYESIIRVAIHLGQETNDIIEFAKQKEKEEEEDLKTSIQHDIMLAMLRSSENETLDDAPEMVYVKDLVDAIGWGDEKRATQKLGYILKNMGLKTVRRKDGTVIPFTGSNEHRIKYLYNRYKV